MSDLDDLHEHLAATEQLPVERTASRWLGEAQAIAGDLAMGDPDAETVRKRVADVQDLLEEVDGTGSEAADEHVAAARENAAAILDDE